LPPSRKFALHLTLTSIDRIPKLDRKLVSLARRKALQLAAAANI
jgi:hypothetical protein